jgi:hypothetical protein
MFPLGTTSLEFGVQGCGLRSSGPVVFLREAQGELLPCSILSHPIGICLDLFAFFPQDPAPEILKRDQSDGVSR